MGKMWYAINILQLFLRVADVVRAFSPVHVVHKTKTKYQSEINPKVGFVWITPAFNKNIKNHINQIYDWFFSSFQHTTVYRVFVHFCWFSLALLILYIMLPFRYKIASIGIANLAVMTSNNTGKYWAVSCLRIGRSRDYQLRQDFLKSKKF